MPKPIRRRISPTARESINEAGKWREAAGQLLKKAAGAAAAANAMSYAGKAILARDSLLGVNRQTRVRTQIKINNARAKAEKIARKARSGALRTREIARDHIGAAKEIVEKQNPARAAKRGRRYRDGHLF